MDALIKAVRALVSDIDEMQPHGDSDNYWFGPFPEHQITGELEEMVNVGWPNLAIVLEQVKKELVKHDPTGDLMTDDTARVEAALAFLQRYGDELDRLEIPPNGDDWNDTVNGAVSILRDGVVPDIKLKTTQR